MKLIFLSGTGRLLLWWQERGTYTVKASKWAMDVWKRKSTVPITQCCGFIARLLAPHLEFLSELQVDVVHLWDWNIVIFSLLLVQHLVPDRDEKWRNKWIYYLLTFSLPPSTYTETHLCSLECLQACSLSAVLHYFLSNVHIFWQLVEWPKTQSSLPRVAIIP